LINAGIPKLALRIAVVVIPDGERHAVLTVATNQGDYVLDSLRNDIRPWTDTDYTWIKRQAANSAWNWVALNGNSDLEVASITGATNPAQ
jgi:predicted transglutaminase-like cysteine proteinase